MVFVLWSLLNDQKHPSMPIDWHRKIVCFVQSIRPQVSDSDLDCISSLKRFLYDEGVMEHLKQVHGDLIGLPEDQVAQRDAKLAKLKIAV